MATGILGQAALTAATNTTVYTVPATTFTVMAVSVLNRGTTVATVRTKWCVRKNRYHDERR